MRKSSHLLASLAFFGWTTAANAALVQEIFFYFPGDGTTVDSFGTNIPPASLLPSLTVTFPTPSGLCISPCWDIGIKPSNFDSSVNTANWVPGSLTAGGEWTSPPGGNGPAQFDPLVITGEILEEGSDDPTSFEAVITTQDDTPPGTQGEGEGGTSGGGGINDVQFCSTDAQQEEVCVEGTAINRTVPLPSTLLLFGLGLFGLARFSRSKR